MSSGLRSPAALQDPLPLLFERSSRSRDDTKLLFYSLSSYASHVISVPKASDKWLTGSTRGIMLAFDPKTFSLSLLNPFTGKEISLPPLLNLGKTASGAFRPKFVRSKKAVVISGSYRKRAFSLLFCQIGDIKEWVSFGQPGFGEPDIGGAYLKGMFFVNQGNMGATHVIDETIDAVISVIPPPNHENSGGFDYLIESNGELLRVYRRFDSNIDFKDCFFEIHRLDGEVGNLRWVKVENIGDKILFLDRSHGFSFSSGLRGNCIYFTKHDYYTKYSKGKVLCRYDIGNGTTEVLPCHLDTSGTWIVPNLQ